MRPTYLDCQLGKELRGLEVEMKKLSLGAKVLEEAVLYDETWC